MTRKFTFLLLLAAIALCAAASGEPAGKSFTYRGHKVFYIEAGQGEPMIFLHNGGTSHKIWDAQVKHFSAKYHVYALDHLGFGKSDKPDIDYPLELHIGQLEAFVKHIGAPRVILVGHCMGGAMSVNFSARHPEKVSKLILSNVYTEQTLLAGMLAEKYKKYAADPNNLKAAVAEIEKNAAADRSAVTLERVIARADTYALTDRLKLPKNMPPMLLIWGEKNPVLPLAAGEALRAKLQPQKFAPIAQCGHMVMQQNPPAFIAAMEEFLAQ